VPGPVIATPPPASPTPAAAAATATTPPTAAPIATVSPLVPWNRGNIFAPILGDVPAGWQVEPCEGEAPMLCVAEGQDFLGPVELLVIPLRSYEEFQGYLEEQGLTVGQAPQESEAYDAAARAALADLAESHLAVIQADREATYRPGVRFEPLPLEPAAIGRLPGLTFGFVSIDDDENVTERYRNVVTFDGQAIYWLGAPYDPANVTTWVSEEALRRFEPALLEVAAALEVPLPAVATEVNQIEVVGDEVYFNAAYGEGALEPAPTGAPIPVLGISPDGRWWQVQCFETQLCWLPADGENVLIIE
jgi:hypothetical protein